MAAVAPGTLTTLEAPSSLPFASNEVNSATVVTAPRSYLVNLFQCKTPLPVDDPAIGSQALADGLAAVCGSFSGQSYSSQAAAISGLNTSQNIPSGCSKVGQVSLLSGVPVDLYAANNLNCLALWQQGNWVFELKGDLSGTGQNGQPAWISTAEGVTTYMANHVLPGTQGVFICDIAEDGLHANLTWNFGKNLYSTSVYHEVITALSLAASMSLYHGS